ncbi:hemagglutinin repeat-containing protein [Herminiimonas glaciei]|uniref:Hemagglutinin repeat-containing protein n=1 Tax=Herminiimonas glaciei TaxID=523788 RepID=A0ABW2I7Q6_9BURK
MNKHLYRIVFNKARGIMMAVAENVSAQGKGDTASSMHGVIKPVIEQICLQLKSISFAAKLVAGVMTFIMPVSYAQIVADQNAPSNQRPTIVQTANGLPQVNIQTPSAAGVSRNTYSQFDVQSNGAILNNSRGNVQTQTGGWVQGNPWLSGGAARVILNEVNSSNPSQLRGYVEVAGQKAEVIIANPSGIQVNGGGFINADRVTLTTGTAVVNQVNNGSLDSYRISQGVISVDGLGLDTRGATYTDILARSVQVNAGIWANKLKVVTGANEVSTNSATGNVTQGVTPIAATGTTPQFSLDVAALGGMYAGHIYLVGSESGMGVRNQGAINANGGNLVLLSNGFLTNEGAIQAASLNGTGGKLSIETTGNISNRGANAVISAQEQADIVSAADIVNTIDARIDAGHNLTVTAHTLSNAGKLGAGDVVSLNANKLDNEASGEIAATTNKMLVSDVLTNRGLIDGNTTLLQVSTLNNIGTGRIYGDQLSIAAEILNNDTETIDSLRSDAVIAARERLDLGVGTLNNRDGALLFSAGTAATAMNIGRNLDAQAHATGTADEVTNKAATIESMGGMAISARQLNNLNPDFSTRTDTFNESTYVHYVRLGGVRYLESALGRCFKCASDRYDDGDPTLPRYEYVAPSSAYPFEAGYSRVPYQLNTYEMVLDSENGYVNVQVPYHYPTDSPVWALFGVAVGDQSTLRSYLQSYNQNLISRSYRDYYHIWVTNIQTVQTVVDNPGTPGRIVSASGMKLSGGAILNDNSQILAGRDLDISGSTLTNKETMGQRVVTNYGTFRGDTVNYKKYRIHEGLFGTGSEVFVSESVTTKLDTSVAKGNVSASGTGTQVAGPRTPPTSSLVTLNPDPNDSHIYKGDPRFNNQQQWLSSDYMLQVLATDPNTIQKRLGDGFYEQMLIREQIAELTGRRFLDGYASDEAQYQALMQAGAAYAKQWELVPGVSLSPEQMAKLTSDIVWLVAQEVLLPDGTITTALVPQVYVMPRPGDLSTGGSLLAGQNVNIQLTGDLKNSGTIAGRNVMQINADNVQNLGEIAGKTVSVAAQQDLINLGGRIVAEDSLTASAGRDLVVESTTSSATSSAGRSSSSLTQIDRVAGLYVTGDKGILVASAGNDFSVLAGVLSSKGDIQVTAGHDVKLDTVETSFKSDLTANDRNYMRASGTEDVGSQIAAGGKISVTAGNNFSATAASVNAKEDLSIKAAGDIQIAEGRATSQSDDARYAKSKGFLSSSSTESREQSLSDTAIGSNFGGKNVTLSSGGDTLIRGSTVIGDKDTTIVAGKDLNIEAATNTSQSSSFYESKKSGLFSGGGLSITLGKQQLNIDKDRQSTTASASTVGSVGGDVKLVAGQTYSQVGSDVLAPTGDISIAAKKVDIVAAINTATNITEQRYKQSGLTLAVSSPIISAIQTVQQMTDAASRTQDGRMQALAGATTALSVSNTYDAIQRGQGTTINGKENQIPTTDAKGNPSSRDANAADQVGGVNISISIGASSSQSKTTQTSTQVAGSNVTAGGNVTIVASGDGKNSDVTIHGSNVSARDNVLIAAEDQINIVAAKNTDEQHSTNKSSSGSLGISFGTSGFGVTASASSGRGNADGTDVDWTNSHVGAGNQLALVSGGDTNLIGAIASGKQVVANVGGDLNIESLQDTSKYDSKQKDIAGSITIGAGGGGSLSFSKSSINSNYASVSEQSGIKAGDNGFQIVVSGNTDLKGAIIASTDKAIEANKNSLITGSLTSSDIQNKADYKGSSVGLGVGYSAGGKGVGTDQKGSAITGALQTPGSTLSSTNGGLSATAPIAMSASGSSSSVTQSGISAGTVIITDEEKQKNLTGKDVVSTIASINSNVSTDKDGSNALKPIFNESEIRAGFEIVGAFSKEAGTFLTNRALEAEAAKKEIAGKILASNDSKEIEILKAQSAEADRWSVGGTYRNIATALVAASAGNITGSSVQMLQAAATNYLQSLGAQQIKEFADAIGDENVRSALHALSACAGAAMQSQSCSGAAMGAGLGSLINSLLDEVSNATQDQKIARSNLLSTLITAVAVASDIDPVAVSNAVRIETENNAIYRNRSQIAKIVGPDIKKLEDAFIDGKINKSDFLAAQSVLNASAAKIDALITIYNFSDKLPLAENIGNLSPQHKVMFGEAVAGLLTLPGMGTSAYELLNGKTVSGEEANYFFAALGVLPAAGLGKSAVKGAELVRALSSTDGLRRAQLIAENQAKGASFEKAVLEVISKEKNTQAFTAYMPGKMVTVIPDSVLEGNKILEIKNVAYLSNSSQFRAYAELITNGGVGKDGGEIIFSAIELIVNPGTKISQPLKDLIAKSGGTVKVYDPLLKTISPYGGLF